MDVRIGGEHFAGLAVEDIYVTIALRPNEDFPGLSFDRKVEQYIFVDAVVIIQIVRTPLICPNRFAVVWVTREYAGGPFVIAGANFRIPRTRIAGAVINKVEFRVV